jgi:hypothetical protein
VDATPYPERVRRFTAAEHPAAWLAEVADEQLVGDLDNPDARRAALLEILANGNLAAKRLRATVLAATDLASVTVRIGDGQIHLRELPAPLALLNLCAGNAEVGEQVEVTQRFADGSTSMTRDRWPLDLALAEELVRPSAGNLRRLKDNSTRLYARNLGRFGKVGLSVNTGRQPGGCPDRWGVGAANPPRRWRLAVVGYASRSPSTGSLVAGSCRLQERPRQIPQAQQGGANDHPQDMGRELERLAVELERLFDDDLWSERAEQGDDSDDDSNPQRRVGCAIDDLRAASQTLARSATATRSGP